MDDPPTGSGPEAPPSDATPGATSDATEASAVPATVVIDDPDAVALLYDLRYLETLTPFLGRSRPLGEAAELLELAPSTVYRRVRRLVDAGLLIVAGHAPRAGRASPLYRTRGDALFVPFRATPFATVDEMLESIRTNAEAHVAADLTQALERIRPDWGLRIERSPSGREDALLRLVPTAEGYDEGFRDDFLGPDTPAVTAFGSTIPLLPEDALALQRELVELQNRYAAKANPKGAPHYLRLALTPVHPRD